MGRAASYFVGRKKTVRQRACGRVTEGRFCRKVVGVGMKRAAYVSQTMKQATQK